MALSLHSSTNIFVFSDFNKWLKYFHVTHVANIQMFSFSVAQSNSGFLDLFP